MYIFSLNLKSKFYFALKKISLILICLVLFFGCSDSVQFNIPAIQGIKDGDLLFKSTFFSSDIVFDGFIVEGRNNLGSVQLVTHIDTLGVYTLGANSPSRAYYKDSEGVVYSTHNIPGLNFPLDAPNGQIVVKNIEYTTPQTVTGSFRFNAYNADGTKRVNFIEGVFYKVPLEGGIIEFNSIDCITATLNANTAKEDFEAIDSSDPDYANQCEFYKSQLIIKINICGDTDGSIQALIDSLGSCN